VGLRALGNIVRTTNRFDRQVAVCGGLGINFRSFSALIASPPPD
jgi:phosphoenolpyruvate-protein kinase (PTS system EI component)